MPASSRLSAAERRAAIIEAAIRLFAERGFRGATTRELAAAVGVSEPVLYQHFPSKADLYKAIIETMMDLANTTYRLDEMHELPPEEFFGRLARFILDFHEKNADYVRLLLYSGLERHELSRFFHEKHVCAHFEFLTGYVRRQIEKGVFRPVDPLVAASAFTAMIADHAKRRVLFPDQATVIEPLIDGVVEIFLRGVMRSEPSA